MKKLIALSEPDNQACELCGTLFRRGAVVLHRHGAVIAVGGTCLKLLLEASLPPNFDLSRARRNTGEKLSRTYGETIDPGNWIRWITEHAPKRYAERVAMLEALNVTLSAKDLDELIEYHDEHRLFPASVLINVQLTQAMLKKTIPPQLTIAQARKYELKIDNESDRVRIPSFSADFARNEAVPYISDDAVLISAWNELTRRERRALTAIAALDKKSKQSGNPLCTAEEFRHWPAPGRAPAFVWNNRIGLGFVETADILDGEKASVWLWSSERYTASFYNLNFWAGVKGCTEEDLESVEYYAFAR